MDSSNSNIYVAELLQQLEDLKRKKARRLQKLKKLKKPSSCPQENVIKDISSRSTENISVHSDEKQSNSGSKCVKCGLCLISKDSPCIQCISAECKENKGKPGSENTTIALKVMSGDSENQTISCPEVLEIGKDSKSAFKHKQTKQILPLNTINEIPKCDSPFNVLEPVQNKITTNLKEKISNTELSRKQRKRSTTVEDDLDQGDHKKFRLSEDTLQNNILNTSLPNSDAFKEKSEAFPVDKPNDLEEKENPQSKVCANTIEDSLFHNMSCFLASDLLVEDEDNVKVDIGIEEFVRASSPKSVIDVEGNVCGLKPTENYVPEIPNCSTGDKVNNNIIESPKPGYSSEQVNFNNSTLIGPVEECEVLAKNKNYLHSTTKSDFSNGDIAKYSGTPNTLHNLNSVHSQDLNDSVQKHTSDNKLLSELDTIYESPTKQSTLAPNKFNDIVKGLENTLNYVPEASNFDIKEHDIEIKENMCEGLSPDSQLIKDLKASDFSSFENSSNSIEKVQLVANVEPENLEDNQADSQLDAPNTSTLKISHRDDIIVSSSGSKSHMIPHIQHKEIEDNETPSLLDTCNELMDCQDNDNALDEDDLNCIPETSAMKCDKVPLQIDDSEQLFDADDALTADIDFECTSLEVADTLEDLLTKSNKSHGGSALYCDKPRAVSSEDTSINVLELNPLDAEVFTIPETVLLESSHNTIFAIQADKSNNKDALESPIKCSDYQAPIDKDDCIEMSKRSYCVPSKELQTSSAYNANGACDIFEETQCDSLDQLQIIPDTVFLDAEDSLALGSYKDIPFIENEVKKTSSSDTEETSEDSDSIMKFLCCLQSEIEEPVNDVKLVTFNSSCYAFIQHVTWIQVWRQEESRDWIKIFSHQIDVKLTLKEICFTKDDKHLVLIMLLCGDQVHCLQFLLFESEARVIKLMEHAHWMQNRCPEERVLLCGLGDLKFATAQGKDSFEVFVHVFSSLDDNPKLAMVTLGSTAGLLHSLCKIDKLPNALMGTSHSTLYVWHLLEARLVTSVSLQLPDELSIEKCVWATIESGLVFFMTVCEGTNHFQSCQLLATNLATGFCQTAMSYSFLPSKDIQILNKKNLKAVYNEPFLAVSCDDGCFLWSASEEHCCAALGAKADVTAVNIGTDRENKLLVAVGNVAGCVNCYSIKCS